jgi:hypothetical protein
MTGRDRLDPLSFTGCIAELESDVPPGVALSAWRSQRSTSRDDRQRVASSEEATAATAERAPEPRTLGARLWARRARSGLRARLEEVAVSPLRSTELLAGQLAARRERREALRRLGRDGRLAAYRRGEFDLDTCCLWSAAYRHEVPLLNGEFEFVARFTPEVCE